jgi:tetratricopeptide (TPR) repeat protein
MRYIHICILFIFCASTSTNAQTWRKDSKMAVQLAKQGRFAESAEKYESAWKLKNNKTEFIEKAGEYYALVRDYKRAAEAYRNIRDNKDYPSARYFFARALKQSGQYTEASQEFSEFANSYKGKDRVSVTEVVQNEIKGCEMAQQFLKNAGKTTIQLSRLSNLVNSSEADFAPIPFADDILYFSSTISGKAVIYRSQKSSGSWNKAILPTGIPTEKEKNVCNGSFSPDGKRFYFTECGGSNTDNLSATCKIYVIIKNDNSWSSPIKLRESINIPTANVSQPFSTQLGDKEILYYASDAEGGIGKMDIWQTTRNITAGDLDFSTPTNLGASVNTIGDDITPYFDTSENMLYFSSNAHLTTGGFDIFKTKMANNIWSKPENVGFPYNSNADDYYFVKNKNKTGGFLVSNRVYGKEKTVTTNEDIFEFSAPTKTLAIRGQILQKDNSSILKDTRITLYEVMNNTQKRLLQTKNNPEADYEFALLPNNKYRLEAEKKGFKTTFYEFSSAKTDSTINGITYNIYLEKQDKPSETSVSTYIEDKTSTKPNSNSSANSKPNSNSNTNASANTSTSTKLNSNSNSKPNSSVGTNTNSNANTSTKPNSSVGTNTNSKPNSSTSSSTATSIGENTKTSESTSTKPTDKTVEKPISPINTDKTSDKTDVLAAKGNDTNFGIGKGTSVGIMPLYETIGPNSEHLLTSAPKQKGTYYKIQILATKDFSADEPRYRSVRDLGRMDTEYIVGKGLSRVLLADFFVYEDAERLLPQVQQNREFKTAYIVKYQDGQRIGTGR